MTNEKSLPAIASAQARPPAKQREADGRGGRIPHSEILECQLYFPVLLVSPIALTLNPDKGRLAKIRLPFYATVARL